MRIKHPLATAIMISSIGAPALASANEIEEITVTATKREGVTVQDVPASISVFGAEVLKDAKIESLTDLTTLSPSLIAVQAQNPSATRIGLRGITTPANNVGFEASVGVSIDGVARSRTGIALSELTELASVEVLRGPQGTLFGRNTSAGVISINTAKPNPEGGGYVLLGAGNYDAQTVQGAINLPISDQWAGRIDAKLRERDGYVDNLNSEQNLNDIDRSVVRGQLMFEGDDSSLRLIADWAESDSICCAMNVYEQNALTGVVKQVAMMKGKIPYGSTEIGDYEAATDTDPTDSATDWGVSAEYNRDIDGMNFTSITAYRDWQSDVVRDGDGTGMDGVDPTVTTTNTSFSQELRLQGETGAVNWLVGAFYLHDKVNNIDTFIVGEQFETYIDKLVAGLSDGKLQAYGTLPTPLQAGANGLPSIRILTEDPDAPDQSKAMTYLDAAANTVTDMVLTTDALALFTHNEISLSDNLIATLGLRYSNEQKDINYNNTSDGSSDACNFTSSSKAGLVINIGGIICPPVGSTIFDGTGSGDRTDESLSGTAKLAYNMSDDSLVYISFSRGFKSGGYNLGRGGFSAEDGASVADLSFDAEEVDAYELGWNSSWNDGNLILNGAIFSQKVDGYQELDFKGTHFEVSQIGFEAEGIELDLTARPLENLMVQANYAYTDAEDEDGVQPSTQSKDTLSASATLFLPVTDGLIGTFHINGRYSSEQRLGGTDYQDGFTLVNGRIAVGPENGAWEVAVFGQNLTDENVAIATFDAPLQPRSRALFPAPPRMYGAEVRFNF